MSFRKTYRCCSFSSANKQHVENGNRIIMPVSAFDQLVTLNIDYPMIFKIKNHSEERASHCGVLEFTADEGMVLLPQWMLQNLQLQEGGLVVIENVSLRKGSFVKLRPHTKDFLNICNPKEFLENALRAYSCLTVGDTIMLPYDNKKYYIDIVETQPSNAISIVDTDCEVDFALPLDYEEPKKPELTTVGSRAIAQEKDAKAKPEISPSMGRGRRLDGKPSELSVAYETYHECSEAMDPTPSTSTTKYSNNKYERSKACRSQQAQEEEKPGFNAFSGKKYVLGSEDLKEKLTKSSVPSTSTVHCSRINEVSSNLQSQEEENPKFAPIIKNNYSTVQEKDEKAKPKISPSMGRGRRLDGKLSSVAYENYLLECFEGKDPTLTTKPSSNTYERTKASSSQKAQEEEKPWFNAFCGKKYVLGSGSEVFKEENGESKDYIPNIKGSGWRLHGLKGSSNLQAQKEENPKFAPVTKNNYTPVQKQYEKVYPVISPSMGRGRRLDGKPSQITVASAATPSPAPQLVSNFNASDIPSRKERINEVRPTKGAQREEESEFEPFKGKRYVLGSS